MEKWKNGIFASLFIKEWKDIRIKLQSASPYYPEGFEVNDTVINVHLHKEGEWEQPSYIYQSCFSSLMVFTGEMSGGVPEFI